MLGSKELLRESASRLSKSIREKANEALLNGEIGKFAELEERAYGIYIMWRLISARTQEEYNEILNGELDK